MWSCIYPSPMKKNGFYLIQGFHKEVIFFTRHPDTENEFQVCILYQDADTAEQIHKHRIGSNSALYKHLKEVNTEKELEKN